MIPRCRDDLITGGLWRVGMSSSEVFRGFERLRVGALAQTEQTRWSLDQAYEL